MHNFLYSFDNEQGSSSYMSQPSKVDFGQIWVHSLFFFNDRSEIICSSRFGRVLKNLFCSGSNYYFYFLISEWEGGRSIQSDQLSKIRQNQLHRWPGSSLNVYVLRVE